MQVVSLYLFAGKQQTTRFRGQESGLSYLKFSAELNEQQELGKKRLKLK